LSFPPTDIDSRNQRKLWKNEAEADYQRTLLSYFLVNIGGQHKGNTRNGTYYLGRVITSTGEPLPGVVVIVTTAMSLKCCFCAIRVQKMMRDKIHSEQHSTARGQQRGYPSRCAPTVVFHDAPYISAAQPPCALVTNGIIAASAA
jgi:hypothetical protein